MLPLLKLVSDGQEYKYRDLIESLAIEFEVTDEERKELSADGAILRIIISEQQPNEYARTGYIPFEAAYTNFLEELFAIGMHEKQLEQNTSNIPRYISY